jgi:hypothetical protein
MKHTLLEQLLCCWSVGNLLIQAIRTHMFLEFSLLRDDSGSCIGIGKYVAYDVWLELALVKVQVGPHTLDEIFTLWSPFKTFL